MNPESSPVKIDPGVCLPFEVKVRDWRRVEGDRALVERVWNDLDGLAYTYIWQCLLSF